MTPAGVRGRVLRAGDLSLPARGCLLLPWFSETRCIWGWGRGQGHPREVSMPASRKGGAILGENRRLIRLWPPDPLLVILLVNGNSPCLCRRRGWDGGLCLGPVSCQAPYWRGGLCQGSMPKWREGALPDGVCRQGQRRRCASGGGEACGHGQL